MQSLDYGNPRQNLYPTRSLNIQQMKPLMCPYKNAEEFFAALGFRNIYQTFKAVQSVFSSISEGHSRKTQLEVEYECFNLIKNSVIDCVQSLEPSESIVYSSPVKSALFDNSPIKHFYDDEDEDEQKMENARIIKFEESIFQEKEEEKLAKNQQFPKPLKEKKNDKNILVQKMSESLQFDKENAQQLMNQGKKKRKNHKQKSNRIENGFFEDVVKQIYQEYRKLFRSYLESLAVLYDHLTQQNLKVKLKAILSQTYERYRSLRINQKTSSNSEKMLLFVQSCADDFSGLHQLIVSFKENKSQLV